MTGDVTLAGHPAGLTNIPFGGIGIADALASAQPPGNPVRYRFISGVSGTAGGEAVTYGDLRKHAIDVFIDTDGSVTAGEGWRPVISGGKIIALQREGQ